MNFENQLLEKTIKLDEALTDWFSKDPTISTTRKPVRVRVSYKKELCEVFTIQNQANLKNDLVQFMKKEFEEGDIKSVHQGSSTTEYKPIDWYENIADNIINRLIQYFQTTKGQTERDM